MDEDLERLMADAKRSAAANAAPGPTSPAVVTPPPPPVRLASRTLRLLARWIDAAFVALFGAIAYAGLVVAFGTGLADSRLKLGEMFQALGFGLGFALVCLGGVGAVLLMLYQWGSLALTGQTIGKRVVEVRVENVDGSPCGFVNGVLFREWIPWFLMAIPVLHLADCLAILGPTRRCLHDRLAGTRVVSVGQPGRPRRWGRLALCLLSLGAAFAAVVWLRPDLVSDARAWLTPEPAPASEPAPLSPEAPLPPEADVTFEGRPLSAWLADLRGPEPRTRWTAAQALGRAGAAGHPVVDALVRALGDEHFMVRADAATALGAIGVGASSATTALARATADEAETVRKAAARALDQIQ